MSNETLTYTVQRGSATDPSLRERMLGIWVRTVNAGGAVGFLAPVTAEDVAPVLDRWLSAVAEASCALVVLMVDEEPVGFAFLESPYKPYMRHWATATSVMVDPARQGRGLGRALMEAVASVARDEGLEALRLSARGGLGLEEFYRHVGYIEIGRYPAAIRVAPGDDRDEVLLWRSLV